MSVNLLLAPSASTLHLVLLYAQLVLLVPTVPTLIMEFMLTGQVFVLQACTPEVKQLRAMIVPQEANVSYPLIPCQTLA